MDSHTSSSPHHIRKRIGNATGRYRGVSRALKYKKRRNSQPLRVKVDLPKEHGVVVGPYALQFIGEVSSWIKEICPLNVKRWKDIPEEKIARLYGKINVSYS